MIYSITRELETALKAKGVPLPVVYGPERSGTALTRPRIVVERDRQAGDVVKWSPRVPMRNPRAVDRRMQGVQIRIYAKSDLSGAGVWDHERIADHSVDAILVALRGIIESRKNEIAVQSSRFLNAAELDETLQTWPGVVYEIKLQIDRGVFESIWSLETSAVAAPVAIIGGEHGIGISTSLTASGSGVNSALPSASTEVVPNG